MSKAKDYTIQAEYAYRHQTRCRTVQNFANLKHTAAANKDQKCTDQPRSNKSRNRSGFVLLPARKTIHDNRKEARNIRRKGWIQRIILESGMANIYCARIKIILTPAKVIGKVKHKSTDVEKSQKNQRDNNEPALYKPHPRLFSFRRIDKLALIACTSGELRSLVSLGNGKLSCLSAA